MRDLVITQNITVDGVVEATDDWFASAGQDDPEVDAALAEQRDNSDGFLVGRETFVGMRDSWGPRTDDTTGVTAHLNRVDKYVVSSTLDDPGWANSEILRGDLRTAIGEISSRPGRDIVCTGSIALCRDLLVMDLVDELRLFTYPFIRGHGRRLFDGAMSQRWMPVEVTSFPSGVVLSRHRRA